MYSYGSLHLLSCPMYLDFNGPCKCCESRNSPMSASAPCFVPNFMQEDTLAATSLVEADVAKLAPLLPARMSSPHELTFERNDDWSLICLFPQ